MDPYPDIKMKEIILGVFFIINKTDNIFCCLYYISRMRSIDARQSAGTHVGIADSFNFFKSVFCRDPVKLFEIKVDTFNQNFRIYFFRKPGKAFKISK